MPILYASCPVSYDVRRTNASPESYGIPRPALRKTEPGKEGEVSKEKGDRESSEDGHGSDPIRWFGILVPPALRAAQSVFKSAVLEDVGPLLRVDAEMKEVEIEIRRARKKLRKLG